MEATSKRYCERHNSGTGFPAQAFRQRSDQYQYVVFCRLEEVRYGSQPVPNNKVNILDKLIQDFVAGDPSRQAMLDEEAAKVAKRIALYQERKREREQKELHRICHAIRMDHDGSRREELTAELSEFLFGRQPQPEKMN
jgi:hypothetical protein